MADTKHEISMKVAAIAALLSKDSELSYETRYGYLQLLLGYVVQERDTAVAQNAAAMEIVRAVANGETRHAEIVDKWVLVFENSTLSYTQTIWHNARKLTTESEGSTDAN